MKDRIALVTDSALEDRKVWLAKLSYAMPDETLVLFEDLAEHERSEIRIAIVADPDPEKLTLLPNLVWVQSLWAGVERLVKTLADKPFKIVRMEDPEMARTMAEAVLAWTLYLHRGMPRYIAQQRRKEWIEHHQIRTTERRVGILGLGNLGARAAQLLASQSFPVSGWSRSEKLIEGITCLSGASGLEELLKTSDILVCLIPLTTETHGLLGRTNLALLPKGASLINFARGPIVKTDALIDALDTGYIDHAVLDVFDQEPLPQTSPLWSHPKVSVLPHISGPTDRDTAAVIVAENIGAFRKTGVIPEAVDMERGY